MTCPICGNETVRKWRPFCSKRCADVDLGNWFSGIYATPGEDEETLPDALPEKGAYPDPDDGPQTH